MQEHFNGDEYMNSTKFPKATYKGTITNIAAINFTKNGSYAATSEGSLTIRGITKKIKTTGTVSIANGKPIIKTVFKIALKDYGIAGSEIGGSIAKDIEITLNAVYN